MTPLQLAVPFICIVWIVGLLGWLYWARKTKVPGMDTNHAEKMARANQELWATGKCPVCKSGEWLHSEGCALDKWLGPRVGGR